MWHLIKKDNKVLLKNLVAYFMSLFIPTLMVLLNLLISTTSIMHITMTVVEQGSQLRSALEEQLVNQENLDFIVKNEIDPDKAADDLRNKKTNIVLIMDESNHIRLYYDESRSESLLALQYAAGFLQKINLEDMRAAHPDLADEYLEKQLFKIDEMKNIGRGTQINARRYALLSMGIIWIFIFSPLSNGLMQIQQERSSGTYLYIMKIPKSKALMLISKQTAIIIQSLLAFLLFIAIAAIFKMRNGELLKPVNIPVIILILASICSAGHCLGFIFNGASATILTYLLSMPTLLLSSANITSALDPVLKLLPTHYAGQIIKSIMDGVGISPVNIAIVAAFMILFFTLSVLQFRKIR